MAFSAPVSNVRPSLAVCGSVCHLETVWWLGNLHGFASSSLLRNDSRIVVVISEVGVGI